MKLGNLEIRLNRNVPPYAEPDRDLTGAFAVSDLDALWLGVHQCINEVERETIEAARTYVKDTNKCIAAIGASEGAQMCRLRLIQKREVALREVKKGT